MNNLTRTSIEITIMRQRMLASQWHSKINSAYLFHQKYALFTLGADSPHISTSESQYDR